jgi:hypothetical protein
VNSPLCLGFVWFLEFLSNMKPANDKVINLDTTNPGTTNRKPTDS